jgi:hypothetical protein
MIYLSRLSPKKEARAVEAEASTASLESQALADKLATRFGLQGAADALQAVHPAEDEEVTGAEDLASLLSEDDTNEPASLISVARSGDRRLKRNCATSLARLSSKAALRTSIIKAGALPALSIMFNTGEEVAIRRNSAIALCHLLKDIQDKSITKTGPLQAVLASSLRDDDMELQLRALQTLVAFASSEDGDPQSMLMEHGLMRTLHGLTRSTSAEVVKLWADLLHKMTSRKKNRSLLMDEGLLKLTMALVASPVPEGSMVGLNILHSVVNDREHLDSVLSFQGEDNMSFLVRLVRMADVGSEEDTKGLVADKAAEIVEDVSKTQIGRHAILEAAPLTPFINLAKGKRESLRLFAGRLFRELCADMSCKAKLIRMGAVLALVALSSGEGQLEMDCAVALCSLLLSNVGSDGESAEGGMGDSSLLEMGALGALAALARSSEFELQQRAADTLCDLSADFKACREMVEAGGVRIVLQLSKTDSMPIRSKCAVVLHNFSTLTEMLERFIRDGLIESLVSLSQDVARIPVGDSAQRMSMAWSCAAGLANLSKQQSMHAKYITTGAIQALVELSKSLSMEAKQACAVALCNLACTPSCRAPLLEAGVVPVLVALARANSETVKAECGQALCNLSCEPGLEEAITTAGAPSGLLITALFRSDTVGTKEVCIATLFNLMVEPEARKHLLNDETIWGFTRVSIDNDSVPIRSFCSRAVEAISHIQDARPRLIAQKCVQAVARMCSRVEVLSDETVSLRSLAVTLRNLCSDAPSLGDKLIVAGAGSALAKLTCTRDSETMYQAVCAFANMLASADSCKALLPPLAVDIFNKLAPDARPMSTAAKKAHSLMLSALANYTAQPEHHTAMVNAGIMDAVVASCRHLELRDVRCAVTALRNLSTCNEVETLGSIVRGGAARALTDCVGQLQASLREARDMASSLAEAQLSFEKRLRLRLQCNAEHVLSMMATTAFNLCCAEDALDVFATEGGAHVIVELMRTTTRCSTLLTLARGLVLMSTSKATYAHLVEAQALTTCFKAAHMVIGLRDEIMALKFKSSEGYFGSAEALEEDVADMAAFVAAMRRCVARLAHNLTCSPTVREVMLHHHLVHNMVQVCALHVDDPPSATGAFPLHPDVAEELARIGVRFLYNLTAGMHGDSNAALLREGGMVALLRVAKQFSERDDVVTHMAAAALSNISKDAPRRRRMAELGAVPVLTQLARSSEERVRGVATVALKNVTSEGDSQDKMVEDGGVEMLVQLMMTSADDEFDEDDGDELNLGRKKKATAVPPMQRGWLLVPALPSETARIAHDVAMSSMADPGPGQARLPHPSDTGAGAADPAAPVRPHVEGMRALLRQLTSQAAGMVTGVPPAGARAVSGDATSGEGDTAGTEGQLQYYVQRIGDIATAADAEVTLAPTQFDRTLPSDIWNKLRGASMASLECIPRRSLAAEAAAKAASSAAVEADLLGEPTLSPSGTGRRAGQLEPLDVSKTPRRMAGGASLPSSRRSRR